jgi:hypothetical protein
VFAGSNSVFNNIMNSMQTIVSGGPSQAGFSQAELNARQASAEQAGATEARNLKGAAASGAAAIGGGNTVTPAGSTQATVMSAEQKAAADTAAAQNEIQQENYATGRQNFFQAAGAEEQAPNVFNASNAANKNATDSLQNAETSQQNIDTQDNWWKTDIMKLGMGAAGAFTGGFAGQVGKDLGNNVVS